MSIRSDISIPPSLSTSAAAAAATVHTDEVFPRPGQYGYASVQGVREQNEDLVSMLIEVPRQLYCVHDGHGGQAAVQKLHHFLSANAHEHLLALPKDAQPAQYIAAMADMYYKALEELKSEVSGVVSISALVTPTTLYFGWVGDCEGCLFRNDKTEQSVTCVEIDYASKLMEHMEETLHSRHNMVVATTPHAFATEPFLRQGTGFAPLCPPVLQTREHYQTLQQVKPLDFEDRGSRREWMLHATTPTTLDLTVLDVGDRRMLVDARLSGAIQPTRALGDFAEANKAVLRHPTILMVPLMPTPQHQFILLCSDGMFSRGALEDIGQACTLALNPLHFVRQHLYRRGQELTERLIVAGELTPSLSGDGRPLTKKWQKCEAKWSSALQFLRDEHLRAVHSEAMLATFEPGSVAMHTKWLGEAQKAMQWLQDHTASVAVMPSLGHCSPELAAGTVCHLALLMGSIDNITALLAAL